MSRDMLKAHSGSEDACKVLDRALALRGETQGGSPIDFRFGQTEAGTK